MSLVHPQSCPATKSELDIFVVPPTQQAIERKYEVEYRPIAALTGDAPLIEFIIPASGSTYYDLDETYLQVKMKAKLYKTTQAAGKVAVAIADASRDKFSPVNNFLQSLFQRVDLEMNGRLVTATSQHYPYRSMLEVLLNYDHNAMDTNIKGSGWVRDTDFKVSKARSKFVADDGSIDLYGRVRLDIFNQGRLLIGGLEMKLSLQAHRPTFYFITSDAEHTVEVEWTQVALFLTCAKLHNPVLSAQERALATHPKEKHRAKYPITRVEVKQFVIAAGVGNVPLDTVFSGQLPRRMFMVMVDNSAENGSFTTNPFKFEHFEVEYLSCLFNGEPHPAIAMTPDFTKKHYNREYQYLFKNMAATRPSLTITPEEFGNGYTIFTWNFAPDYTDGCSQHWNYAKRGTCRLELRFSKALEKVITILFLAEFDNVIEIDSDRNVFTDF